MNFLPRLRRRVTTVLFRRQFDATGASRRWPATATMASQQAAALAARSGDLVSVLNGVALALVTEDEAFVRLLAVGLGELRLQILPAAQVDTSLNEELRGGGGRNLGQ